MKQRHIIGIGVILLFAVFSIVNFSSSLTPYVAFAQAKGMSGDVQVRGVIVPSSIMQGDSVRKVKFLLRDESGEEVTVDYSGIKPDGLEQATSVVAVGKYQEGKFVTQKLLVKCPSKYQGSVKQE